MAYKYCLNSSCRRRNEYTLANCEHCGSDIYDVEITQVDLGDPAPIGRRDDLPSTGILPRELARDYELAGDENGRTRLGRTSAQADVVLVRSPTAHQDLKVAKIYRSGVKPRATVLNALKELTQEQLTEAAPTFVIKLFEYGESDRLLIDHEWVWYELQEYVREGSLADFLKEKEGGKLPPETVRSIVTQLNQALQVIHGRAPPIMHLDLKPSNILLRQKEPLELVLIDFGSSIDADFTTRLNDADNTARYAPPEAFGNGNAASIQHDWWSLGMITAELLTGRHPLADCAPNQIATQLNEPIDLQAIWESRELREPWARLCRGLLRADRGRRWGAGEVTDWLKNEMVSLEEREEDWLREGDQSVLKEWAKHPFIFSGTESYTLRELGKNLVKKWDGAVELFDGNGDPHLARWLWTDLRDRNAHATFIDIMRSNTRERRLIYFAHYIFRIPEMVGKTIPDNVCKIILQAHVGAADAQCELGKLYLKEGHNGIEQSDELAISWFEKAAEAGHVEAMIDLADLYLSDDHERDIEEAVRWYEKAVKKLGDEKAPPSLADLAVKIEPVRTDIPAKAGYPEEQFKLGEKFEQEKDDKQAAKWYLKAAKRGHAEAQYRIGCMYEKCRGVEGNQFVNKFEALSWYRKAKEQGHEEATKRLSLAGFNPFPVICVVLFVAFALSKIGVNGGWTLCAAGVVGYFVFQEFR